MTPAKLSDRSGPCIVPWLVYFEGWQYEQVEHITDEFAKQVLNGDRWVDRWCSRCCEVPLCKHYDTLIAMSEWYTMRLNSRYHMLCPVCVRFCKEYKMPVTDPILSEVSDDF